MASESGRRAHGHGLARRILLSVVVASTLGPLAIGGGIAAFGATASAAGGFAAGTVYLTTEGTGTMFSVPNVVPGVTATSYTKLSYQGSLPADLRFFASVSGTGLARYLQVTVTRGTGRGSRFVPDAADYRGAGPGVVFHGTLAEVPTTWSTGIADPGTWTAGESHTYRFQVELAEAPAGRGLTANADFRWEAWNV